MPKAKRETPRVWCDPEAWPHGPFRPPDKTTHDLVVVEQLAMLAVEIQKLYPLDRRTQDDIEDAADISRAGISAITHGHNFPSLDVLCRLTAAMGYRLTLTEWQVGKPGPRQDGDMPEREVWPERVQQPAAIENAYSRRRTMPKLPAQRGRLRAKGEGGKGEGGKGRSTT